MKEVTLQKLIIPSWALIGREEEEIYRLRKERVARDKYLLEGKKDEAGRQRLLHEENRRLELIRTENDLLRAEEEAEEKHQCHTDSPVRRQVDTAPIYQADILSTLQNDLTASPRWAYTTQGYPASPPLPSRVG